MRKASYLFFIIFFSFLSLVAEIEPDSFSQESEERKKYLDPGVGVRDNFFDESFTQEFCDFILSTAPVEIIEKIKLMTNPFCPSELRPRRIILVGPSGSGKTSLAKIIGILSIRPVVYINAGMLGNEFKNSAVQNLRRAIEPYMNSSCVVILDEIDCLLKQSQHDRNPDVDLPKQIWEMFDICGEFPNITLIGITNDISGMPEPLKTRLAGDIIEIPMMDTLEKRKDIFDFYLKKIVHDCSDADLKAITKETKKLSHRELEKLIKDAYAGAFLRDNFFPKIKIEDFEKAFIKIQKSRKLLNKINWKDYEKHFQYGIQASGVLVSCVGIVVSTYMAYLSLKVSKDAHEIGKQGLAYSKQNGKECREQAERHFEKNYALTKEIAEKNDRRAVEGQLLQKMHAILSRFFHPDGFQREIDHEKTAFLSTDVVPTETSQAALQLYWEGREILCNVYKGTFDALVDKVLKERKIR